MFEIWVNLFDATIHSVLDFSAKVIDAVLDSSVDEL